MSAVPRILVALLGGSIAALGLLWLMQWLVLTEHHPQAMRSDRPVMEFVRLQQHSRSEAQARELPPQQPPAERAPPSPSLPEMPATQAPRIAPQIEMNVPRLALDFAGPYLGPVRQGPPDRDFMPISRLPPRYPYRAQRRGIEGWVRVSFLITEQGEVEDAVVMDAEPEGVFEQAALRAVGKWRFKPRIQDGRPVSVRAEQVVRFQLQGNRR